MQRQMMQDLYDEAKANRVPILLDDAARLIDSWLLLKKPEWILEVGAAVGYSAIRMALVCPQATIHTIERDPDRARQARSNIKGFHLEDRIHLLEGDALDLIKTCRGPYDLAFIDAAKGQYGRFFDDAFPLIADQGAIICDNMLFHGMLEGKDVPKRYKTLVKRLKAFHQTLLHHQELDTRILSVDDGVSISIKRGKK
jgi:predicted O-methyltransferase YrrM